MVKLFCAMVGVKGSAFPVEIDESQSVGDLKDAIKTKKAPDLAAVSANKLQLYLAKKGDTRTDIDSNKRKRGAWLDLSTDDVQKLENGDVTPAIRALTDEDKKLQAVFEIKKVLKDMLPPRFEQIHVLVVVPQQEQWDEERARKKARSLTVIEVERMNSMAATLDIDSWQNGGIALDICSVEPDFPAWFYVRKETEDIIKIFHDHMEKNLSTVFVGTPGVGKSMLVVLFAFYLALHQQKRVVLFRKLKTEGFSMLYLDGQKKHYWRSNKASLSDLDELRGQDFELCLDGLMHKDVDNNFATLASFRLLATSVQYPTKNNEGPVRRCCLVPLWSKLDLNAIGIRFRWSEFDIKKRYYYSGGNLRVFLSEKSVVIDSIDQDVGLVDAEVAEVLNTQYALGSDKQIDRLRMTSVRACEQDRENESSLDKYTMRRSWFCVITSEYALRKLGTIVKPSYYENLWSKGRMLGDDGLMGIAFENYVHDGKGRTEV